MEPKSYTAIYLFFDSLLSACPKKMETEWPKAADSPVQGIFEIFGVLKLLYLSHFELT